MGYFIGLLLSLGVAALAAIMGLDRERVFYATVLIVIASYHVLFAVMGGRSTRCLWKSSLPARFCCRRPGLQNQHVADCGRSRRTRNL